MTKIFFVMFFVVCMVSSCKKFLEQPPYNNVSVEEIFKDFEGARTTVIGLYDKLKSTEYYLRDLYVYPEITGGNVKYSKAANQLQFASYNFTRTELADNDLRNFYTQAYAIIYGANSVLQNVDRASDANQFQKNRMRADALAIRALTHFDLVRTFAQPYAFTPDASHAGIVLRTSNPPVLTPTPQRATVKQVFDQVMVDLDSAINLYANSVNIYPTGDGRTFFTADAAKALKARVALYRNDWQMVVALTTELISSNRYPLVSNGQYVSSWVGKNISSESIFELAYGTRTGGSLGDYFNPVVSLTFQLAASNDLLTLYGAGDVRGQNSLYISRVINASTYYFTRKYQGISDTANNIKLLRASELYLGRAEAQAKLGNLTPALTDLNVIRKRANPASINFTSADQQAIIDEILIERRRELAFEGHLFFDIARNKKDLVRVDNTATIKSFTYPSDYYAYPIPINQ
jgi:starch-binding outer membrane protein, SusD/RagB family